MKRVLLLAAVVGAGSLLAGCATTADAQKEMTTRYLGQRSDDFFAQNGAPYSSFKLDNGSTIYRWRGGEANPSRCAELFKPR